MADDQDKPSNIKWAATAWQDAAAAIQRMPVALAFGTFVVIVVEVLSEIFVLPKPRDGVNFSKDLLIFIVGIVEAFFLTPIAIAVHRFVLLGELTVNYRLDPADPRFRRFFLFSLVIQIVFLIPGMMVSSVEASTSDWMPPLILMVSMLLGVYAVVVMLRTLILFPAIAVDAAGAKWSNALQDTAGHVWRIFFICVATGIPIIVAYVALISVSLDDLPLVGVVIVAATNAIVTMLTTIVYAALASRMFVALGKRLADADGDSLSER